MGVQLVEINCVAHCKTRFGSQSFSICYTEERNEGGTIPGCHNSPGDKSLWGRRMTARGAESPNNVRSNFFNTVHLLPKDLRFKHGGAKFASCPGRHLTSLRTRKYMPNPWNRVLLREAGYPCGFRVPVYSGQARDKKCLCD